MDIKILDSWLRDYLETPAKAEKIAELLSLSGPSVERIEKSGNDYIYDIEITTNRIDTVSVYGIAREASAILPRAGIAAKLKRIVNSSKNFNFVKKVNYLDAKIDPLLCPRFTAVLIKNVAIDSSPDWLTNRLEKSGVRAINNAVDISNYIMLGLGQPVHTFDYDKIKDAKMILRGSRKGETITTLDGKTFILPGGDIVIEDGSGKLIDLAGVMGGDLSKVDEKTKNILLFVQTYNPKAIRKTSMSLAQRTLAATIFEKGIDTELVTPGILTGINLFEEICKGAAEKEILNIYPTPFKISKIKVDYDEILRKLGIGISKSEISKILLPLEFETSWKGNTLEVVPPSFRSADVVASEDVIEEIARIYGYHNLPSLLMEGMLPSEPQDKKFIFEDKIKDILAGFGGCEVYTLSLVPQDFAGENSLKLKNPLGTDTEYLRTSLMPSLIAAAKSNTSSENFHLFEMANVYLPRRSGAKGSDLPEEKLMLAGIFNGYSFREGKGVVEALLLKSGIAYEFYSTDMKGFSANRVAVIKSGGREAGTLGITDDNLIYYEFPVETLKKLADKPARYEEISKYPSQIEDLTFTLPEKSKIGEIISGISAVSKIIKKVELKDIFKDSYTFGIEFHSDLKTLTDGDVENVRSQIISSVKTKFGGVQK